VLLFLVLFCGLVVLLLFQHLGFSNMGHADNNFFNFLNPGLLGVLNVLEFLWGLQFLRDACKNRPTQSHSSPRAMRSSGTGAEPTTMMNRPASTVWWAKTGAAWWQALSPTPS
jgi:hypothetical protein